MKMLHAKCLIKHSRNTYGDLCFAPHLIQIIINIVMLGCWPNVDVGLCKTFLQEFLQSKMENDDAKCNFSIPTLIETCGNRNFVQIEIIWNGLTYVVSKQGIGKLPPETNGISSKPISMMLHEFDNCTSFTSLRNNTPIT
jgi:hypothetical protein